EAAVFQDEVDLNLNPDIGCMWMRRGEQAEVVTPGTNVKRYLSGSMSWRTGELVVTEGTRRNAELFVRHLDDLRRAFRHYKVIHVLCDNAGTHTAVKGREQHRQIPALGHDGGEPGRPVVCQPLGRGGQGHHPRGLELGR
ncbi:transposase, partial [Escherichia coli]|nr:transposase [Escherichia coli]